MARTLPALSQRAALILPLWLRAALDGPCVARRAALHRAPVRAPSVVRLVASGVVAAAVGASADRHRAPHLALAVPGARHSAMESLGPAVSAAEAAVGAAHGGPLPAELSGRIPWSDTQILAFLLAFLESEGLGAVPLYINGGYVRDLLLGKEPDDLDLSLCLRDCAASVTVGDLLQRLPAFAASRPELGVAQVKLATILSNTAKDKNIDTFKAHFVDGAGKKTEVDLMPTIGKEVAFADGKAARDLRGAPEDDALRRDLTIGALLLRVTSAPPGLGYELLDFYGGIEDIRRGVLRSPAPTAPLAEVRALVVRTAADEELAAQLALDALPEAEALQILWWGKILLDDPNRICRALRFAAKYRFRLHDAFWSAVPFALEALRYRVAGERKNTEHLKIAGLGFRPAAAFFSLAFGHTFGPRRDLRLATALFGGQDAKGRARVMPEVTGFDAEKFRAFASELSSVTDAQELHGGLLALAISASDLQAGGHAPFDEFVCACDGTSASNAVREAGSSVLMPAARLAAAADTPGRLEAAFAAAFGIEAPNFALHAQVLEALNLCVSRTGPAGAEAWRRRAALALLGESEAARRVRGAAEALAVERPLVRGTILRAPAFSNVPPQMRGKVMLLVDVGLRLIGHADAVESEEHFEALFKTRPALRECLAPSMWFEEDGKTLRQEFQTRKNSKK